MKLNYVEKLEKQRAELVLEIQNFLLAVSNTINHPDVKLSFPVKFLKNYRELLKRYRQNQRI